MVEAAPSSVDLQDFQFKLHSKCKIFDNSDDSKFKNSYSLTAAASRYGLIFFGSADASLEVIQLNALQNIEPTNVKTESNCAKRSVPLCSKPSHLAVNCDSTLLAVVCNKNDCATAIIYNVSSFLSQNVSIVREIRLSATPGVNVLEATWNPAIPTILTTCKNDGSLGVYNIQETSADINELPVAAGAKCFCWSPKGKQLVVGGANGSLTQYKPDLKAVKVIQTPPLNGKGSFCVINVFWLTNYQFLAIYKDAGDEDARPMILIVNAPKTGNITFINYEDICYSYGNLRQPQYYIIHQPVWGVILVASANSMEVGVLGISQAGEPALWQQWNQIDAARAELPLSANHQETFPVGVSFDTGVTMQLPWGENQTLPPMPMIHILSHHGVLCSFSVINLKQGAANLCSPPETIPDQSGLNQFIVKQMSPPSLPSNTAMAKPEIPAPQPMLPSSSMPGTPIAFEQQKTTVQSSLFGGQKPPGIQETGAGAPAGLPSFGGSSQFSFGSSSIPNFQSPNQPTTISNKDTPLFSPSPSPANTFSQGSVSTPVNLSMVGENANSSMFGALATSNFNTSASKTTMFGISTPTATTTPSLGSFTSKTATPTNSLSFSNTSLNTPNQQTNVSFTSKPTSLPLLATPKEPTLHANLIQKPTPILKPELIENKSDSNSQLSGSQIGSDTVVKDDSVIKDQMIQALIKEEVKNFHGELQDLFFRCKNINLNVGSEEEKTNLVLETDLLLEFYKELKDTTDSQVSEVYYLKQALMQSFAWYEDTKARHKRYTDPNFASLLQAQELDPVSEKQMADIKHLVYYIEAQLKQIDGFLDNQWADFQDSCKKHIKGKLHIPTLEPIYQSLVRQNAILERQKYVLKDIGARIKSRNKKAANFPHVMNKLNTSVKNIENIQLYEELNNLKIEGDIFQSKYEKIVAYEKKFTDTKKTKLYDFFSNRNVNHIAPRKPKFVSNIFQMSPSKFNPTYTTSPGVNRSLRSTFDSIAQQSRSSFDATLNTSVEANMSSSNLFSFTLLESSKFKTPEKPKTKADLLFNTPKASDNSKTVLNPFPKLQEPSNPLAYGSPSQSIFNFTATSTAATQGKQQNSTCVMSNAFAPSSNFTFDQTKFASVMPDTAKSSSGTTFFSFSSPSASITDSKATEMNKTPEVKSAAKVPEASTFLGGLSTGDNTANQSFNFIAPQAKPLATAPKTNLVKNIFKGAGDVSFAPRDSLDAGFSFGNLDLGQQSTPKPKATVAASSSLFSQVSSSAQSTVKTTLSMPDSSLKPAFAFVQPSTTVSQASADNTPLLPGVTITPVSKLATSAGPTTVSSMFGGVSTAPVKTMPSIFGLSQSSSSIFSSSSSTEVVESSPLVEVKSPAPENITTTVVSTTPIATSSASGLIVSSACVTQAASTASIVTTTPSITVILPASTAALTTAASPSTFSFTQLSSAVSSSAPVKTTSLFGGTGAASSTSPSKFAATSSPATSTFSFIQPATSTPSMFGGSDAAKTGSIFGIQVTATETSKSGTLFGTAVATTVTTKPSTLFGTPIVTAESTKPTSIFGTPAVTTDAANSGSIFGTPAAGTEITKSGSIFAPTEISKSGSVYGTQTTIAESPKPTSIFGTSTTNTTSSSTGFASPATIAQTQSGFGFGTQTTSSESTFSFGQLTVSALSPNANINTTAAAATTTTTTNTSTFSFAIPAASATTTAIAATSSTNVFGGFGSQSGFGKPATTTTASSFMGQSVCSPSAFSQNQQSQQSSSGSIFGQAAGNVFAQKPSSTASGTSIFGQSGGSIFGQSTGNTTASTTASSIFGQTQSSPFGSSAQSITSGGSIFGQSTGFTSPTATTASTSIFGQNTFGTPATTSASGSFSFTQSASGSSGFGGSSTGGSIFASKPAFGAATAFGQPPAFGSPPSFGATPASPSVFGSPAPANNSGTFGSGFGSPSAFGQKPAFGSPPSFGQSSFGSSPAFGASSTFGSPNRVFGGGAAPAAGNFGATVQENSTFANLANQSTLGFGSLAQNQAPAAPQQQAPQFSGGAQFSSWR